MNNSACTVELSGLENMIKALKEKPIPLARVGILGQNNSRETVGQSNADIGLAHEFGNSVVPERSFLRIPLKDHLNQKLEEAGAFTDEVLKEVMKQKTIRPWLEKVMHVAVNVVTGAFDSRGYGKWPPWKNPNYTNNANQLLVDTGQLRDSITGDVR